MGKRDNGTGTIRKVKGVNGIRYYAYGPATYECDDEGTVTCHREPLGRFDKRTDARKALEDYSRRPTLKYNYTMAKIYEDWKASAFTDISKATQNNYTSAWTQILIADRALTEKRFRDVKTSEMRAILDFWMKEHEVEIEKNGKKQKKRMGPLSFSSHTKIKALLTQLYKFAMADKIIDQNYAALVKIPRDAEAGTIRAFTDAEFEILEKNWERVEGGDAVYALCYLGFRVSEFCNLSPSDYDSKAETLTGGLKTEAGRNRIVPVHPKIKNLIETWVAKGDAALYADKKGKHYNKDRFTNNVWKPAMAALGLPSELTPHSARHTCGTRLAAAGARPEDIQAILGHSDYSETANTYINQDISTLSKSMAMMK